MASVLRSTGRPMAVSPTILEEKRIDVRVEGMKAEVVFVRANKRWRISSISFEHMLPGMERLELGLKITGYVAKFDHDGRVKGIDCGNWGATFEYSDRGESVVKEMHLLFMKGLNTVLYGNDAEHTANVISTYVSQMRVKVDFGRLKTLELAKTGGPADEGLWADELSAVLPRFKEDGGLRKFVGHMRSVQKIAMRIAESPKVRAELREKTIQVSFKDLVAAEA